MDNDSENDLKMFRRHLQILNEDYCGLLSLLNIEKQAREEESQSIKEYKSALEVVMETMAKIYTMSFTEHNIKSEFIKNAINDSLRKRLQELGMTLLLHDPHTMVESNDCVKYESDDIITNVADLDQKVHSITQIGIKGSVLQEPLLYERVSLYRCSVDEVIQQSNQIELATIVDVEEDNEASDGTNEQLIYEKTEQDAVYTNLCNLNEEKQVESACDNHSINYHNQNDVDICSINGDRLSLEASPSCYSYISFILLLDGNIRIGSIIVYDKQHPLSISLLERSGSLVIRIDYSKMIFRFVPEDSIFYKGVFYKNSKSEFKNNRLDYIFDKDLDNKYFIVGCYNSASISHKVEGPNVGSYVIHEKTKDCVPRHTIWYILYNIGTFQKKDSNYIAEAKCESIEDLIMRWGWSYNIADKVANLLGVKKNKELEDVCNRSYEQLKNKSKKKGF